MMVYRGTVKDGRIQLEAGVELPEGTPVRVEVLAEDWVKGLEAFAREVSRKSPGEPSLVDELVQSRR